MSVPTTILSLSFGQPVGTTSRVMCPKCLGGSNQELSLSLSIDDAGGVHWLCFRASCGYRGGPRGLRPVYAKAVKKEPRIYTRSIVEPGPQQREVLHTLFKTDFQGASLGYNHETDRFLLPILGPKFNQHRGYIARSFSGGTPKAINYGESVPFIHFAYPKTTARRFVVVVVEDWFSAEKVAQAGFTGVSINGTNLNQEMVNELVDQKQAVCIAFDADAFQKSLLYHMRYKEQFPIGLYVAKLERDLKYLEPSEIGELIKSVTRGTNPSGSHEGSQSL